MGSSHELVVLTAGDVDKVLANLDLELALKAQQDVFSAFSTSCKRTASDEASPAIQIPHRSSLTTDSQRTLVMPSRAGELLGCKFVGIPNEGSGGLPGSTVLLDPETGRVRGLVNARKLTALRNACGSALSLRALPPKRNPTNLLIFGSGAQAHAHALVFLRIFPSFTSCTIVVRRSTPRSDELLAELRSTCPKITFTLGVSSSEDGSFNLSQAVHNASVILTLVPTTTPLFKSVDVTSGTHLVLVGSYKPEMRDVDDELIRRAGVVVVDSKEACRQEAGELISAGIGSEGMVELGELCCEEVEDVRGRMGASGGDVTIFKSVGIGIQDVAIASLVVEEARKMKLGTIVKDFD